MSDPSPWIPEAGEIVWLHEDKTKFRNINQGLPDWAPNHLAVVIHLTSDQVAKRFAWLLPISSTIPNSDRCRPFVHFQYDYNPAVADHDPLRCSDRCTKFLFLLEQMNGVPDMNKASYVDTRNVYSLPLELLKQHRQPLYQWQLRVCSRNLIMDLARDTIASHMADWQVYHGAPMPCEKLGPNDLTEDGLVCWVNPASKKVVDVNGTSYEGCGPCIVFRSDSKTAEIYVMLDDRGLQPNAENFPTLRADEERYCLPVVSPTRANPAQYAGVSFLWPKESSRRMFVSDQIIVLCPSFRVSIEELYHLPSCFLPKGTRVSADSILYSQDFAAIIGSSMNACAARREERDAEKNWLESTQEEVKRLNSSGKLEEAKVLERKRQEVLRRRQNEQSQQEHETSLQKVEEAMAKAEIGITSAPKVITQMSTTRARGPRTVVRETDPRIEYLNWWEVEYLLCATMARLRKDGPIIVTEEDPNMTKAHEARSALMHQIEKLFIGRVTSPPSLDRREALRSALEVPTDRCDTLAKLMKLFPRTRWEDLMTEEVGSSDEFSETASSTSTRTPDHSSTSTETPDAVSGGAHEECEDTTQSMKKE